MANASITVRRSARLAACLVALAVADTGNPAHAMLPAGLDSRANIGAYLDALVPSTTAGSLPALLSQTGTYSNLVSRTPHAGLIPYSTGSSLWTDGSLKSRYIGLPYGGATGSPTIGFATTGAWSFPNGTVFVKNFDLVVDERAGAANPVRRLETRILVRLSNGGIRGATYKWRLDNTDADIVSVTQNETVTITQANNTPRSQVWLYPSPAQCVLCHNNDAGMVLGVKTAQQNSNYTYPATGRTDNQLHTWNHLGMFNQSIADPPSVYAGMADVMDTSATMEHRVKSYQDANCSHCHRPSGTRPFNADGPLFDMRFDTPILSPVGAGRIPIVANNGNDGLVRRNIANSSIHERDGSTNNFDKMPPLARNVPDQRILDLYSQWVNYAYDVASATRLSLTSLRLKFNRAVEAGSANVPTNYALSGGATVSAAVQGTDLSEVVLTTSTLASNTNYTLTVNRVKEQAVPQNPIWPNTIFTFTTPPPPTVPGAPAITIAAAGNAQITLSFTPPASDGGSLILDYTATCGAISLVGAASPITVTGIANGTPTTCTVRARNAVGSGTLSTASSAVTPKSPSTIIVSGAATSLQGVAVSFTASVTGASPSGNVAFKDGASVIAGCGAVALAGGAAQCNTAALPLGARSITAEYAGDGPNLASVSAAFPHTVAAADTTPDPFSFAAQSNVPNSSLRTSDTITVTSINLLATISVANGEYSLGCAVGGFTTTAATIAPGGTVCVRHTSSAVPNTGVTTTLTIGGVAGTFTSTTAPVWALTVTKGGSSAGNVLSNPAGITCGSTCTASFANGTSMTLTATADANNMFVNWAGVTCNGGVNTNSTCTFALGAGTGVAANFALNTYAVTAIAGANGTIGPPSQTVDHGQTTTFTVTPNSNHVAVVTGCGGALAGTTYTTGPITAPCGVTASFVALVVFNVILEGAQETPPLGVTGTGAGTATVNLVAKTITLNLTFSGMTGALAAAHLHGAAARGTATGVVHTIGTASPITNVVSYDPLMEADIVNGLWYVNLQTAANGGGEIRGQLDNLGPAGKTLTVVRNGTGGGGVAGTGIGCGIDCAETFPHNTLVTLAATADSGSIFAGWSGGGCAGSGACTVTMDFVRTITATFNAAPFALSDVASRKRHSGIDRDIPVAHTEPLAENVTVEPRMIGAGHRIVFAFNMPVTQAGTASASVGAATATVNPNNANEVIVTLTGVPDNTRVMVNLNGVGGVGGADFSAPVGFLVGDVSNSRSVNAVDIAAVKARQSPTVDATNFRFDLDASGAIIGADVSAAKARSGAVLP